MKEIQLNHGIVRSHIFGFDSVSCNAKDGISSLEDHPGFKYMVDRANIAPDDVEQWMSNGELKTNKKGLLWKHIDTTPPSAMTRAQLIKRVTEWGPIVQDYADVKQHTTFLIEMLQETEKAHIEAVNAYEKERLSNDNVMNQLLAKIKECGELQKENNKLRLGSTQK